MDTYLTISEASRITQVSEELLYQLVSSGRIRTAKLSTGAVLVNQEDVQSHAPIEQQDAYQHFAHLKGNLINMSDAALKYGVPQQTFSRWVAKGFINRAGTDGRKVLMDEAEVATIVEIYKSRGGGQGRWVFKDGSIYTPKKK